MQAICPGTHGRQVAYHGRFAGAQVFLQFQRLHGPGHGQVRIGHDQNRGFPGQVGQLFVRRWLQMDETRACIQRGIRLRLAAQKHDRPRRQIRRQALDPGHIHAPIDDAPENDQGTLQSLEGGDAHRLPIGLPICNIHAVGQQRRRPSHLGQARLQILADRDHLVGPLHQAFFQPPHARLIQSRPLTEIIHTVIDPAGHG